MPRNPISQSVGSERLDRKVGRLRYGARPERIAFRSDPACAREIGDRFPSVSGRSARPAIVSSGLTPSPDFSRFTTNTRGNIPVKPFPIPVEPLPRSKFRPDRFRDRRAKRHSMPRSPERGPTPVTSGLLISNTLFSKNYRPSVGSICGSGRTEIGSGRTETRGDARLESEAVEPRFSSREGVEPELTARFGRRGRSGAAGRASETLPIKPVSGNLLAPARPIYYVLRII